ncbi:HD domain-containing protein [Candidatus Woesearchaeota archaeon]|jgi:3'-5' exoribonuclease|nr:HD domain-containing protein [Candidatus Woesearchaeota archaeon]MBT6518308.1 HD domain-containing protein [Candidatus Woesearchaeota archaeon]MBT7367265.1 HD domain-containing protein [Candidatus Woesearchaeota archaeon]
MIRKNQFIQDLKKDDIINDIFVVKFKKPVEPYKNGYKFELRLGDSTKEIMYKFWGSQNEDAVKIIYESINKNDVVLIQGRVSEWRDVLEIAANDQHTIKILSPGEYDVSDFVRKTKYDIEQMWVALMQYLDSVTDSEIKKVLEHFFKNSEFAERFKISPAAMYIHHGWIGGLLEHTLSVVKIIDGIHKVHPTLNRDLMIAGAMIHDIGKLDEFEVTTNIRPSKRGMLVGHVTIGIDMLERSMDKIETPEDLRLKLIHMLLTHMGEYGSSKTPSFPEALAVFYADQTDARITQIKTLVEGANTEDDSIYHKDFGNVFLE